MTIWGVLGLMFLVLLAGLALLCWLVGRALADLDRMSADSERD